MRVVLDTNVVMSAIFFGGTPRKIVRAAFSKKVDLVASNRLHRISRGCGKTTRAVSVRKLPSPAIHSRKQTDDGSPRHTSRSRLPRS